MDGSCTETFAPLRDLLARNLADGTDVGAAVAVVHDGELVVDLWGGQARPGVPWERDTLVQVWSVTKTMVALAALLLADRGELDLDAPVARYWPAWAVHGKDGVLVRQLLAHSSGVPGWSRRVDVADLLDLELTESWLAEETPWYPPGSASAYQMINHGHLIDAVVRGACGRSVAEVLRAELTGPLAQDGFHLGVPDDRLDRCADVIAPEGSALDILALGRDHFLVRTVLNPVLGPDVFNGERWRRGEVGAAGGHGNARGVALVQAAVSHGGEVGGRRVLGAATLDRIWDVQADGPDLVLLQPLTWGVGYALPTASAPAVPSGRVAWWTGWGGSIVVNDADRRLTFAYTPNRLVDHMIASPRTDEYVRTAFACVTGAAS